MFLYLGKRDTTVKNSYLFSFLMLCMPALFGAASSSSTPPEQYEQVQQSIPSLQELALRKITTIVPLKKTESTRTPLKSAIVSTFTTFLPATLKPGVEKAADDFMHQMVVPENLQPEDLRALIATLGLTEDQLHITVPSSTSTPNNTVYATLEDELFNRLAHIIAKDYFLKSPPQTVGHSGFFKGRDPQSLPAWLREHFTAVSIQDLLDYKIDYKLYIMFALWGFSFNNMYINDLAGFENIPGIATTPRLFLQGNQITTIKPGTFANLPQLKELWLHNNPIAENPEERARIEEEVRIATNGQGLVIWNP